ncbi:unnamed protein product [Cladocopium goreaui]|uniref:Uncharacterized protein n=1 Tax=Cladocopium goreaui TaxID=2562237 RepID=A0A9P1GG18_9DINO|nr:unnamed protein product [Cladocopium goreaui]
MPTAIELATAQLRLHCNQDLERIPLNKVLDGLWSVLMWASGLSAEMNFEHISAKQKGMHIGTAAVFMVADCLLRCHLKQRVLACLEISIDFLLSWLFLDGKNFGRKPEGALRALAGLFVANGMAILKGRARTQQSHQVGQLLCPDHRSIFWPKSFPEQSLAQRRQAIDRFVHLQLLAVRAPNIDLEAYGCNLQNCAVVYQWLGPSRYVGVASLQRASRPGMPGPALRWWEHLLHWSRGYVGHHLREGTFEGGVASAQFEKALARVSRAQQYNAHRAEPQDLVRALGMDFRSAYRHVQQHRFAQSGVLGPLNIYSPGHWRLLLLFLGSFGASVHWACVDKHWRSPCSAILLWKKAKLWLVGRRLQLAQQKFDDLLHSRRLPSTRGFTITVPQRCFIPAVKSALRLGVASQPSWDKMMRNYVVESTRIAVGKVRTFADKQNCAQQAQVFDWDEVRQCSDSELADAVRATGARRVETNWRVPMPSMREDDLSSVKQCLRGWCGAFLSPKVAKTCRGHAARQLEATRAWKMHHQRVGALTAEHEHIFSQFSAGKQEVICPDDKMKQYKWIVPKKTYFLMMAFFVCVSSAWCAVDMSVEEAQAWCVALLTAFVPARLRRQFGVVPGRWFLPYCYNSMKPKCFSNGRRSCEKPGHSCMRRIVSYVKWPARRMWRQAGRALTFILQMTICTDEIWALNTARRDLERKMARLLPARQAGRCDRCHGACAEIQGITADAGQFFECVSAFEACSAWPPRQFLAGKSIAGILTKTDGRLLNSGGMIGCGLTLLLVGDMSMTSFGSAGRFALGALKKGCSMLTQCPLRLEVAVRGSEKDFHHDRDKRRRGGHRSQRDLGAEDVRRRSKAAGDKEKKRKKKKRSSSSSSSASPSSSSSSSVAKKKQARKQAKKAAERAQASEDRLMAEIQKLKKTLKPSSEPVTPAKLPATRACEQLTPKAQSHLKTLLSFMSDGEVTPLVDVGKVHTWHDIEDQLNGKTLPVLKQFLSTRIPEPEIPSRKAPAIQKVLQLARDALPC